MDTYEIKLENPIYDQQCSVCLSVGRKLLPLGQYTHIFMLITSDLPYPDLSLSNIMLCWECLALLHKVSTFQHNVQTANELLQLGQNYINGSLSTLKTVINNESLLYTLGVSETDIPTDIQTDDIKEYESDDNKDINFMETNDFNESVQENDSINDFNESKIEIGLTNDFYDHKQENELTNDFNESIKENDSENDCQNDKEVKIPEYNKERNPRKKRRWERRRMLQNKKPKFITISNHTIDDVFRNIPTSTAEFTAVACDRDRVYGSSEWKCDRCIRGFQKQSSLIAHDKKYHSENKEVLICEVCNKRMDTKRQLASHMSTHFFKYECKLCDYVTRRATLRMLHIKNYHPHLYRCVQCELVFGNQRKFFRHFKEWHSNFKCDHCGVNFKMKYLIIKHIKTQHSPYECKVCDRRFPRRNRLWAHNRAHHAPDADARAAYCVECDRQFADYTKYQWHLTTKRHAPHRQRRHPCPDCDKVFTKKIYMTQHRDLIHLQCYKYHCETCDKNFLRKSALDRHNKTTHEGVKPVKNKMCLICGRGFSTKKILENHIRTHTGERPFPCTHCDARFTQQYALTTHIRAIHNNNRPGKHKKMK